MKVEQQIEKLQEQVDYLYNRLNINREKNELDEKFKALRIEFKKICQSLCVKTEQNVNNNHWYNRLSEEGQALKRAEYNKTADSLSRESSYCELEREKVGKKLHELEDEYREKGLTLPTDREMDI
ncbi:MAG: hypothetical protein V3U87_17880 [Methylococcaceae bacterium]